MSTGILPFLTAPYPLRRSVAADWAFVLGPGIFVALFLLFFQPFGTADFQHPHKQAFLAGYGVVIAAAGFIIVYIAPRLFPGWFDEERWTVGKHILLLLSSFGIAIAGCYFYKDWFLGHSLSWRGFIGFFPLALSIALFPIVGIVAGAYIRRLKHYASGAEMANQRVNHREEVASPDLITLADESGRPALEVHATDLLFLRAADNYVEVFYLLDGQPARTMIRNTLSVMEKILPPGHFFRCHRSFLVNLNRVERLSGNAQGYRLHFGGVAELSAPVARGRNAELLSLLG